MPGLDIDLDFSLGLQDAWLFLFKLLKHKLIIKRDLVHLEILFNLTQPILCDVFPPFL